METLWLMYASIAVWLGLGGYILLLGKKASRLETRLERLQYLAEKSAGTPPKDEA